LAIIPLCGFYVISTVFGSIWAVCYLLFYIFLYRPFIDTQRLLSLGKIEEKDAWKFFVPLQVDEIRYTRNLWLD
jgi:hypothetical protein